MISRSVEERTVVQETEVVYMTCDNCGHKQDCTEDAKVHFNFIPTGWSHLVFKGDHTDWCPSCTEKVFRRLKRDKKKDS